MKRITKLLAVFGFALAMSSGASAVTIYSIDTILPYDCDSSDGQIDIEVMGFGPFTYTLQGPMFGTQLPNQPDTISFPNLGAGTYTLTVLDQYDNSTDMIDISLQPYGEICADPGCPIEDFGLESSFDCDTLRGAITITDLEAELAYAVTFEGPMGISTGDIVSDPAGQIVFDNLEVGTYLITVCDVGPKTVVLTDAPCQEGRFSLDVGGKLEPCRNMTFCYEVIVTNLQEVDAQDLEVTSLLDPSWEVVSIADCALGPYNGPSQTGVWTNPNQPTFTFNENDSGSWQIPFLGAGESICLQLCIAAADVGNITLSVCLSEQN